MNIDMMQSTTVPILQQVLDFTETRHTLLAGNIANMETPNYRIRDLSPTTFQERLKEAIVNREAQQQPISPGLTAADFDSDMTRVKESMKHILFHDKSDVRVEDQVAEMSKNQFMHNIAISILNHQFQLMHAAISERV